MVERPETEFDTWPDPVLLVDSEGCIRRANDPACRIFGYSPTEIVGVMLRSLAPRDQSERQAWVRAMFERDDDDLSESSGVNVTCLARDGKPLKAFATFASAPIYGENWTWVQLVVETVVPERSVDQIKLVTASPVHLVGIAERIRQQSDSGPVARLGTLLQTIVTLDAVFDDIARDLARVLKYNLFGVSTIDQQERTVCLAHLSHVGVDPVPSRGQGAKYPLDKTIAEAVLDSRSVTMTNALDSSEIKQKYPGTVPSQSGDFFLSNIAAPVFDCERVRGLIFVSSSESNVYNEKDVQLMSELAGTIRAA